MAPRSPVLFCKFDCDEPGHGIDPTTDLSLRNDQRGPAASYCRQSRARQIAATNVTVPVNNVLVLSDMRFSFP